MIPFYIFYSMFGFQRIGDLAWAAGDMQARGFLLGATAGRTTLNGEGLQHQDGHSTLLCSTIPNCVSYDPTYAFEMAVIIQDGMRRMMKEQENLFYYITTMNENYSHPEMPEGAEEGIIKGMYLLHDNQTKSKQKKVQLLGSGTILREVIAAADVLAKEYEVEADIWSVTSFNELRREGMDVERWNRHHPEEPAKQSYVSRCLKDKKGPVIATTDHMKIVSDQIRAFVPADYTVLGTDGYGRSDSRENLRDFFEVDCKHIVVATLKALADNGDIEASVVSKAIKKYALDTEKKNPVYL
jgi:pyruvate dehydrogenase E1 component